MIFIANASASCFQIIGSVIEEVMNYNYSCSNGMDHLPYVFDNEQFEMAGCRLNVINGKQRERSCSVVVGQQQLFSLLSQCQTTKQSWLLPTTNTM